MARKEDKQPQYLPLIVKAKLVSEAQEAAPKKKTERQQGQQIPEKVLLMEE